MTFKTALDQSDRQYSPPGDGKVAIYELVDGEVRKTGEHDLYHDIQLAKAMCYDINALLSAMVETGDESVLDLRESFYADITSVPDDPADIPGWTNEFIAKASDILKQENDAADPQQKEGDEKVDEN